MQQIGHKTAADHIYNSQGLRKCFTSVL